MADRTLGLLGGHTGHVFRTSQLWRLLCGQGGLDLGFAWRLLGKHHLSVFQRLWAFS